MKFIWQRLSDFDIRWRMEDYFLGAAEDIQWENAQILAGAIVEELSKKGTGRVYNWSRNRFQFRQYRIKGQMRQVRGRWKHRASAPGQPPAVWTNAYRSSWQFRVWRGGRDAVWAVLENPLWDEYGHRLEYGGVSKGRHGGAVYIAPRPHVRPAVRKAQQFIEYRDQVYARVQADAMARARRRHGR